MKLGKKQTEDIGHRGGNLQIVVCAGSGKTKVMARRVVALIEEVATPASNIVLKFTERAAASLKKRIHQLIADVTVKNFPAKPEAESRLKCGVRAVCKHADCDSDNH